MFIFRFAGYKRDARENDMNSVETLKVKLYEKEMKISELEKKIEALQRQMEYSQTVSDIQVNFLVSLHFISRFSVAGGSEIPPRIPFDKNVVFGTFD